jgi:hypothetical protein
MLQGACAHLRNLHNLRSNLRLTISIYIYIEIRTSSCTLNSCNPLIRAKSVIHP